MNKNSGNKKRELSQPNERKNNQSVIIYFDYGLEEIDEIYELGDKLRSVLEENKLGEYDGHEVAMDNSHGSLYFYGPNAESLFKAIKPTIEKVDFLNGAKAFLRFGPLGGEAPEIMLEIRTA
jgi:hypothetical protein